MRLYPWERSAAMQAWELRMTWMESDGLHSAYAHASDMDIAQWDDDMLNRRRSALIKDVLGLFEIRQIVARRGH